MPKITAARSKNGEEQAVGGTTKQDMFDKAGNKMAGAAARSTDTTEIFKWTQLKASFCTSFEMYLCLDTILIVYDN